MTFIKLETKIHADIQKCFDAARDIDLHKLSTKKTNERAIAGRVSGLCEVGDIITWEARHFGVKQYLTVEITAMNHPVYFEDKMLKGAFKSMNHEHHFEEIGADTVMIDHFKYETPFGVFGKIFDTIFLKRYMRNFLISRNMFLKSILENVISK